MGTEIQKLKLTENHFKNNLINKNSLKGNNDLLSKTQPEIIYKIHCDYLMVLINFYLIFNY